MRYRQCPATFTVSSVYCFTFIQLLASAYTKLATPLISPAWRKLPPVIDIDDHLGYLRLLYHASPESFSLVGIFLLFIDEYGSIGH